LIDSDSEEERERYDDGTSALERQAHTDTDKMIIQRCHDNNLF